MFTYFSNLSIRYKLTIIIFLASLAASITLLAAVLILDRQRLIDETNEDARSEILMLSQEFVKIILYGSIDISADIVSKLETFPLIMNSFVFDEKGNVIFSYHKQGVDKIEPPTLSQKETRYEDGFFHIFQPISYYDKKYGVVYSKISDIRLRKLQNDYYLAVAVIFPLVVLGSFLLALWLQRYFSTPVINLTKEISSITETHKYSQRISLPTRDEFGDLYRNYNKLLAEIEIRQKFLKEGEQRLSGMLEIAGSAIISIDKKQRIILFNRQAEEIFGYSSEEVIGGSIDQLIPERYRHSHRDNIINFGKERTDFIKGMSRSDVYGLRSNGEEFPLRASISKGEFSGQLIYTVAIDDVSEIRKKESELSKYQERLEDLVLERTTALERSNKELESYSYSIAHDLRGPLRSITSFSQILLDDVGDTIDEDSKYHLSRIIKSGAHLSVLIDDILQLSKITRSELHYGNIDLSALTEEILQRHREQEPQRKVIWIVEPELKVDGDKHLIELMMDNLIGNAWKFTRNVAKAEISFTREIINDGKVFVVRDNGVGFNMDYSDKLFREFQRLHGIDEFEGTGIGLATVRRILDRHGGNIWADSEPDKGASFFFTL